MNKVKEGDNVEEDSGENHIGRNLDEIVELIDDSDENEETGESELKES